MTYTEMQHVLTLLQQGNSAELVRELVERSVELEQRYPSCKQKRSKALTFFERRHVSTNS